MVDITQSLSYYQEQASEILGDWLLSSLDTTYARLVMADGLKALNASCSPVVRNVFKHCHGGLIKIVSLSLGDIDAKT